YVLIAQVNNDVVFATADSPTGPFKQHHIETPEPMVNGGTGDATTFIDDDGTPYIICSNKSGRSHVYVIPLRESDYLACERTVEIFSGAGGREGNCMFKYKGRYYACSGDLHGWNTSHCYYISSDNILGPYNREAIMINTDLDYAHVTQSGFFITVNGTEDTTVIYCGDRWCNNAGNGTGYNQWCPITIEGTTCTFNSLSQWSIDAVKGTWKIGPRNNHILNPCFEADRITVNSVIGWEGKDPNAEGSSGAGNFCLSLGAGATATQRIPENPTIADLPAGTYEMKADVRGNGQISIADFGDTEMKESVNSSSWTEISISGIKISTGKATVSASNTGGGTCLMDNFSLICTDCTDPTPVVEETAVEQARGTQNIRYNASTHTVTVSHPYTTMTCELFSINGRKLFGRNVTGVSDAVSMQLPERTITNGYYLLKMTLDGISEIRKIGFFK
ncbi:MAG: family 43 glycosylhydrolase, partial [Chitinispirillaceae bacterium]|nr:family 43 glycosylhydrolase [Chitinispirillaceae bacterium]